MSVMHQIQDALMSLAVAIDLLTPDPANARKHGEENIAAIMESLTRFGQDQPLVVQAAGMVVRKGNGRLEAMKRLGWSHAACVIVEEGDWQAVARSLADNRTAELATWDTDILKAQVQQLDAAGERVEGLGWTAADLAALLTPAGDAGPAPERPEPPPDLEFGKPVIVTVDQRTVFERACARLRQTTGIDLSEGRCLELLSAEYLGGPDPTGAELFGSDDTDMGVMSDEPDR